MGKKIVCQLFPGFFRGRGRRIDHGEVRGPRAEDLQQRRPPGAQVSRVVHVGILQDQGHRKEHVQSSSRR